MLKNVWNLQLFADEEGVESAIDTNSIPDDTGVEVSGDAAQNMGEESVDATQEEETVNPETEDEVSFDDLIQGKYKDAFNQKTSEIVQKRVKQMQTDLDEANASMGVLQPMMMALAQKYQLDFNDPNIDQAVVDAVLKDKALYEEAAMEAGMDVDTFMQVQELKRENQEYAERERLSEEERIIREKYERHMMEAEEVKKVYPNFDLMEEIRNYPQFAMQIDCGVPVRNAFEATHFEELAAIRAEAIATKASEKVANSVKANKKRPAENGLEVQPGSQIGTNISGLSIEKLDELEARARRGEKIDLKDFSL
jgi:hypothetical protein